MGPGSSRRPSAVAEAAHWRSVARYAPLAAPARAARRRSAAAAPRSSNSDAAAGSRGDAAPSTSGRSASASGAAPWSLTPYYTKKLERRTDALGNVVSQQPGAIREPPNWNADMRLALAVKAVASELGLEEADVRARVELLRALLPDGQLEGRTSGAIKLVDMVRMCMDVDGVVARLLALREAFPAADVSAMVAKHGALLARPPSELRAAAEEFTQLLLERGGSDPDALAQAMPMLLEPGALAGVLDELERLFGASTPPGRLLQSAPDLALSCQSLQGQSRGERDFDYVRDMFASGGGS